MSKSVKYLRMLKINREHIFVKVEFHYNHKVNFYFCPFYIWCE